MPETPAALPWEQPEWLAEAHAWITDRLAEAGQPAAGPIEQVHIRPWSTILRIPTARGAVYFKAAMPLLAREAALQPALARWHPALTLPTIAADAGRGWLLQPDGGPALRTFLKTPADLPRVEPLLAAFAAMQIDLSERVDELLELVPFDRRLVRLPVLFGLLLDDHRALRLGEEDGLSADQHQRLRRLVGPYRALCAELAAAPIPHSLHHDDFHDGNIFAGEDGTGRVVSDWGESCVAHPFFSVIICLRSLAYRVGLPDETTDVPEALPPVLARLRDVYLAPWERFAPQPELVRLFNLAWRVGMVNRALTWQRVVSSFDPAHRADYAGAVPGWLGEFLTLMERV